MSNPILRETSFADAIKTINESKELGQQCRHWATSLRQIAKALDKPIEVIPARYSAVRADLAQLHQVPAGLSARRCATTRAMRNPLCWLAAIAGVPRYGTKLRRHGNACKRRSTSIWSGGGFMPLRGLLGQRHRPRGCERRSLTISPLPPNHWQRSTLRRLLARAWNSASKAVPGWPTNAACRAAAQIDDRHSLGTVPRRSARRHRSISRDVNACAPQRQRAADQAAETIHAAHTICRAAGRSQDGG